MSEKETMGEKKQNDGNLEATIDLPGDFLEQKMRELNEGIESAQNLINLAENLKSADFPNAALGVAEVAEDLKQIIAPLIKENRGSENFEHTIENILDSEDLFRGENLNLYNEEFNAKLINKIKELIKKEIAQE